MRGERSLASRLGGWGERWPGGAQLLATPRMPCRHPSQAFPPELAAHTALRALYLGEGRRRAHPLAGCKRWLSVGCIEQRPPPLQARTPRVGCLPVAPRIDFTADDNGLASLPAGAYLDGLRVLGIDWRVLFK